MACDTIQETLECPEEGQHEPKLMDKKCLTNNLDFSMDGKSGKDSEAYDLLRSFLVFGPINN